MKFISTIRCFAAAFISAIVTLLLPTLGHAQSTQTYDGGTNTWDQGTTQDWNGANVWNGGDDNANFNGPLNTVTVSGTVTVNTMNFSSGGTTISGGTIEQDPFTSPNYNPGTNPGDETLINLYNGPVTISSQIELSDLGGNQQSYINNDSGSTLSLGNIDFGPYTVNPSATAGRRLNLQDSGGGITLTGNYTTTGGYGGEINLGTNNSSAGVYNITSSANFASMSPYQGGFSSNGGTINIANSTFTSGQTIGFGNPDVTHTVNIQGAQTINLAIYNSTKYGASPATDGVTTYGQVTFNQSTQNVSTWTGYTNLDGSNSTLSAVAGGRLNWSGVLGGDTPEGLTVSGNGVVVLSAPGGNGYDERDGNGQLQPTSLAAATINSGATLLITNTSGSAFGGYSNNYGFYPGTGRNNPVNVLGGGLLGGSGISTQTVVVAGGGIIAPGDAGQSNLGISASIATLHLTGGLTMASGATLAFKLNGNANDALALGSGALTLAGTTNVDFTSLGSVNVFAPGNPNWYTLATGGSGLTAGTWTTNPTFNFTAPAGYNVDHVNYNAAANIFQVDFAAVPEPSTYALMIGGLAFLAFCVRRKNRMV